MFAMIFREEFSLIEANKDKKYGFVFSIVTCIDTLRRRLHCFFNYLLFKKSEKGF